MSSLQLTFSAKKGFLTSQIRILSHTASLSSDWVEGSGGTSSAEFSPAVMDAILVKVNRLCQRRHHVFYNSLAVDHVSEQIDVLYRQRRDYARNPSGLDVMTGRNDLLDPQNIDRFPDTWPIEDSGEGIDEGNEIYHQYKDLVGQVSAMNAGIASIRSKHERLLVLRERISALKDPRENIQPNLVFKDGELALELKRMRILAAKLSNELEPSEVPPLQM